MKINKPYHQITVTTGLQHYPIYIGSGLLQEAALLQQYVTASQVLIVSNKIVANWYLGSLKQAFKQKQCDWISLPDGEQYKTIEVWRDILGELVIRQHHRDTTLIALGGGVIGDIAGFAAACYHRGVNFIQIPTTLLAQVDAAIGGKTALNHSRAKNMIGAFYQPKCVIVDTATLTTLPAREFKAGMAEMIKYGLLAGNPFFDWLEYHLIAILNLSSVELNMAIEECCRIKASMVAEDEKEQGKRVLLNLGHTFAHAIEIATHYKTFLHGEAVAIGLYCASLLSYYLGNIKISQVKRIYRLLQRAGLPTLLPAEIKDDAIIAAMHNDKKILNNQLRFVVMHDIGNAYITSHISQELILKTLNQARTTLK